MEIPKIENRLEVKCDANSEIAEMYLYGTIAKRSMWNDTDTVSAAGVKDMLQNITAKTVKVHINSGGGDTFESIAICNLLKQSKLNIEIYIDSLAGSGGGVIAMAGKVFMAANSMFMAHRASTIIYGNSAELTKTAADLDKIDIAVKASYATKFVGTDEELTQLIADETWLTATECLALGFCDEIIAEKTEKIESEISTKDTIVNKYKKEIKTEVAPVVEIEPATQEPSNFDISNLLKAFSENFK